MKLRFNTGMTFEVDVQKSVHLSRHTPSTYSIEVAGVGRQIIEHDFMCPFAPEIHTILWLNWHIRKSQEVAFEFIPRKK